MPYSADLRSSYAKTKININWFYDAMEDYNEDIQYVASTRITGTEEECKEYSKKQFEQYIEDMLNYYISAKIFNFVPVWKVNLKHIEVFGNVWEFIHNNLDCYKYYDTEVVIKHSEDDD